MHNWAAYQNGCKLPPAKHTSLTKYASFRDYYAALLRTQTSFVAPTQGKLLNYVERVPLGVVAQITVGTPSSTVEISHLICPVNQPFNHPLLIAIKKIAPALAAGNSVIVKPSEVGFKKPLLIV